MMRAPAKDEERRMLRELLETARGLRPYGAVKVGTIAKVKTLLRTAGIAHQGPAARLSPLKAGD